MASLDAFEKWGSMCDLELVVTILMICVYLFIHRCIYMSVCLSGWLPVDSIHTWIHHWCGMWFRLVVPAREFHTLVYALYFKKIQTTAPIFNDVVRTPVVSRKLVGWFQQVSPWVEAFRNVAYIWVNKHLLKHPKVWISEFGSTCRSSSKRMPILTWSLEAKVCSGGSAPGHWLSWRKSIARRFVLQGKSQPDTVGFYHQIKALFDEINSAGGGGGGHDFDAWDAKQIQHHQRLGIWISCPIRNNAVFDLFCLGSPPILGIVVGMGLVSTFSTACCSRSPHFKNPIIPFLPGKTVTGSSNFCDSSSNFWCFGWLICWSVNASSQIQISIRFIQSFVNPMHLLLCWLKWRFPKIGVPLVIIHFERWDVPFINHPLLGTPMT